MSSIINELGLNVSTTRPVVEIPTLRAIQTINVSNTRPIVSHNLVKQLPSKRTVSDSAEYDSVTVMLHGRGSYTAIKAHKVLRPVALRPLQGHTALLPPAPYPFF